MKWEDLRRSKNVQDRRGQNNQSGRTSSNPRGRGGGTNRSSGGLLNLLLPLLMSSGGGKWILIIILALGLFGGGFGLFDGVLDQSSNNQVIQTTTNQQTVNTDDLASDEELDFLAAVLGFTEDYWTQTFENYDMVYEPTSLVVYTAGTPTGGCGYGDSAAGPFYCPADQTIYIDMDLYHQLATRYQAPGDFAMAYVLAHEVGHHVQNLTGIMDEYNSARRGASENTANELNVRLELQADYFAGAWANYVQDHGLLEIGDLEEAMQAAYAVGDDTLQEAAYGRVVPDSFTHGTSQQRQNWFYRGFEYGDFEHSDTFSGSIDI